MPAKSSRSLLSLLFGIVFLLNACSQSAETPSPTSTVEKSETASETATPSTTVTEAIPTPAATSGPPPAGFESNILRPGVIPVNYINDSCRYLQLRWDPTLSGPGTAVAVLMFHSILPEATIPSTPEQINAQTFFAIIDLAEDLGFETITSEELLAFLEDNAKIPKRSMILILDDRRPGTAEDYFLPVLEENSWTTTLAWIIGDTDQREGKRAGESLWDWIERINETGYFDIQSHGLNHIPITEGLDDDFVREEIESSIPILIEHFDQRPIAYIWPGGNYTALGVRVAEEAGFELGFTVHSRGPILFNWIPQGEQELAIGEPFMTLPRYWDSAALLNLEQTVQIGDAARQFARENYEAEAAWYAANCGGQLAPLDQVLR